MARVILSNLSKQPILELRSASNIMWRKALNSLNYCQFDLALTDPYCTPQYLSPSHYVHIFADSADTTQYINADFAGMLINDFQVKPKDGIITCSGAGLAHLLSVCLVANTTSFVNQDAGTIIQGLITGADNYSTLPLTAYSVSPLGPVVYSFMANQYDNVYSDIQKLCQDFAMDFDVRPDFTYAILTREGADKPDLVVRYGQQGNIQVDSTMNLVNTELYNQIYATNTSGATAFVVNNTSVTFYGKKSLSIEDANQNNYSQLDAQTIAQFEATKRGFPLYLLDHVVLVNTPLLPFSQLALGDKVLFEAPSLPMLSSFNGLQRVLAMEYDDRKQTMTLTMGNALYLVQKNKLHELRLY